MDHLLLQLSSDAGAGRPSNSGVEPMRVSWRTQTGEIVPALGHTAKPQRSHAGRSILFLDD